MTADHVRRPRLQAERQSLEALLRPPSIPNILDQSNTHAGSPSAPPSLLSPCDAQILESLASTRTSSEIISSRLNAISVALGPTIDAFADGVHRIAQYRNAADNVAGRVLQMCADKLEDREKEGRRHALGEAAAMTTTKDEVGNVLRSLSRLER
jgi:kinetochore protein Mis13/DSN1